jgi:hypothetical protein
MFNTIDREVVSNRIYTLIGATLAGGRVVWVCEEVAICYQLVATRRPKAVLDVEFDEHFERAVGVTLASMVQEIYAS